MYTEPGIEATACARELLYVYVYVYVYVCDVMEMCFRLCARKTPVKVEYL